MMVDRCPRTRRLALSFLLALPFLLQAGCLRRVLEVRSSPPGAAVYVSGDAAGTAPLEHDFSFYGTVDVELRRTGFRTVHLEKRLTIPWYEYFPLDFVTEFFVPIPLRDVHTVDVTLEEYPPHRDQPSLTVAERGELEAAVKRLRDELNNRPSNSS